MSITIQVLRIKHGTIIAHITEIAIGVKITTIAVKEAEVEEVEGTAETAAAEVGETTIEVTKITLTLHMLKKKMSLNNQHRMVSWIVK
mmetsp:Transcript_29224/g.43336  ORF Transcript_29224/g.43336 Transcript_29224/m.43336 type:complete len:88 (+) Transcript_29224:18-281(+)